MNAYLQLLRPHQWLKNVFVFAPVFFSYNLMKSEAIVPTLVAFASFCLISSSIYCINDAHDAEADRQHPKKCGRPVAAGRVSKGGAFMLSGFCAIGSIALLMFIHTDTPWLPYAIVVGYWLMNMAYCFRLKHYAILDIFCIATGFVMRVLMGGIVTDIWVSQWLVLLTFLLALFLALTKRYDDYAIFERTGTLPRQSIKQYNSTFIIMSIVLVASVTLVCYIMYTMSESVMERFGTPYLYLTSIWVTAGLLRFMQNMIVYERSGSPTKTLLEDHFIHLCLVGWLVSFYIIIYV